MLYKRLAFVLLFIVVCKASTRDDRRPVAQQRPEAVQSEHNDTSSSTTSHQPTYNQQQAQFQQNHQYPSNQRQSTSTTTQTSINRLQQSTNQQSTSQQSTNQQRPTPQINQQRPQGTQQRPQTNRPVTQKPQQLNVDPEVDLQHFYSGIEQFSIDMLRRLSSTHTNIAFSPLTTWVLLALMSEGSKGMTYQEIRNTLSLPEKLNTLHRGFGEIRGDISTSIIGNATLEMGSAIFTNKYIALNPDFEEIAQNYYNTTLENVDFHKPESAAAKINSWVSDLTRGHIPDIVNEASLVDAEVVLASALYFSGVWRDSFNVSQTRTEPFFDDEGNKVADVDMMYRVGCFRITYIDELTSLALELPYSSERNSMLVLLPRKGNTLNELLDKLSNISQPIVASIMQKLETDAMAEPDDEDIHVYLPKFSLKSDVELVQLLKKMGIRRLFTRNQAELQGMVRLNLYVSKMFHKATITATEQGTVAAAASAAILHNYSMPTTFKANHPFLFLIVQKKTNTILFAGKVGAP